MNADPYDFTAMVEAAAAIKEIQRIVSYQDKKSGRPLSDGELANEFACMMLRTEVAAAGPCYDALPPDAQVMAKEWAAEMKTTKCQYYSHLGRCHPAPELWKQRRPLYRKIVAIILAS